MQNGVEMQRKSMIMKRICSCLGAAALVFSLTACSTTGPDDEKVIIVEKEEEQLVYKLTVASVGDVVKTERIKCTYQQMKDQDVSFALNGRRVTKVYVKEGDMVKKGQLLAELGSEDIRNQMDDLEYQIARNKMLLEHSQINEDNNISLLWANLLYYRMGSENSVKSQVANMQQSGRYYREDLQDKIDFDEQQLESLQKTVKQSSVYANMDGTVSFVKENLEGSTSEKDEVVISVIDNTDCLFTVEGVEYADRFKADDLLDMDVISGTGTGAYVLKPAHMEQWKEKLLFSIVEQPEGISPEVGAMGYMAIVVDKVENAICLPLEAIHVAEDKSYVYVLDDDGNRQLLWIETGLEGDTSVQVLSGLSEGDKVILR